MAISGPGANVAPAVGDVLELTIYCAMGNQLGVVTRKHKVTATAGNSVGLGNIAVAYETQVAAAIKALMHVGATFRGTGARIIWPPVHSSAPGYSNALTGPGTVAGDGLPKQVSGVISSYDGLGGRAHRGRSYIPFPGETDSDANGAPIAGYTTRLGNLSANWTQALQVVNGADSVTLQPVLFHRSTQTTTNVIAITNRTRFGTQRRRGDYGRTNAFPV